MNAHSERGMVPINVEDNAHIELKEESIDYGGTQDMNSDSDCLTGVDLN